LITVEINGKRLKNIPIEKTDSYSYLVFTTAINIFTKSDSMLKMIIDHNRLESIKANNYLEIKFNSPANLKIATGGNLSVSNIVIPLSEEETTPEWNFYYSHNYDDWFALRWMQPDSMMFIKLQNEILELINN
jgi:hypothetical protein